MWEYTWWVCELRGVWSFMSVYTSCFDTEYNMYMNFFYIFWYLKIYHSKISHIFINMWYLYIEYIYYINWNLYLNILKQKIGIERC